MAELEAVEDQMEADFEAACGPWWWSQTKAASADELKTHLWSNDCEIIRSNSQVSAYSNNCLLNNIFLKEIQLRLA